MIETQKMIPMDSVARHDSEFSRLEKFVIKATMGTKPKEFPEVVYLDRPPSPITPKSYTVNLMGLNAHKDPIIEQYVRVHKVYAAARYKISDLVRTQGTDLIVQALKDLSIPKNLARLVFMVKQDV